MPTSLPTSSFLLRLNALRLSRPFVVGTLLGTQSIGSQLARARRSGVDSLEIRLDTFSLPNRSMPETVVFSRNLLNEVRKKWTKPVLLTLRSARESHSKRSRLRFWSDKKRSRLLSALLPHCDAVDVEIQSRALAASLTRLCRRSAVAVIHSFHDFKRLPPNVVMDRLLRMSRRLKGDLFKAAVTPKTDEELRRFLRWGKSVERPRPILIAMGPLGAGTRTLGYSFGSVLTYGHLGASAAPGQMPARVLVNEIRSVYVVRG